MPKPPAPPPPVPPIQGDHLTWADALEMGVAVMDGGWTDDGDAYTVQGVSRPAPTGAPVLSSLAPSTLPVDDPPTLLVLTGSGFTREDCRVVFGGAGPPTSFHTGTELAAAINPPDWSAGTIKVQVWSDRGPSAALDFTWTAATVQAESGGVPEGTIAEVLAWVGSDPDRAQQALDAERAGQNRSTLITQLQELGAS